MLVIRRTMAFSNRQDNGNRPRENLFRLTEKVKTTPMGPSKIDVMHDYIRKHPRTVKATNVPRTPVPSLGGSNWSRRTKPRIQIRSRRKRRSGTRKHAAMARVMDWPNTRSGSGTGTTSTLRSRRPGIAKGSFHKNRICKGGVVFNI